MSDCCLMPSRPFFSSIMARTSYISMRWWCLRHTHWIWYLHFYIIFVLDQHTLLDFKTLHTATKSLVKWKTYKLGPLSDENSQWKMRMFLFSGSWGCVGFFRNSSVIPSRVYIFLASWIVNNDNQYNRLIRLA